MKKKLIIMLVIIIVIAGIGAFWIFYKSFFENHQIENRFALNTPMVTAQDDKFNYTWEKKAYDPFVGTGITYKIYHYEGSSWNKIMECGGEYDGDYGIKISSAYEDKNIIVYKIWQYIKAGTENHYIMIDKSNSKATDLSSKLEDACADMTKEQIRNDRLLNQAKAFILNYKLPEDTDYNHYEASFKKIRDAFQEK